MWEILVILVRFPIAILGALGLTLLLPLGIIFSTGYFLLTLIISPLVFLSALFDNKPEKLKSYGNELIKNSPVEIFRIYFQMVEHLFKWALLINE